MKKYITFGLLFVFMAQFAGAQYSTPGTGVVWNFNELALNSGGAVTQTEDVYSIHEDIIISLNDTIRQYDNATLQFYPEKLITVLGVLQVMPTDSILITAQDTLQSYKSFRFEDSDFSIIKNCRIEYGGGLDLLDSDVLIENCTFYRNDQSNSSGVVDLFYSNPQVINCGFYENEGPAVMSAANGQSSPYIYGNEIYRNTASNANMPQINLGTSAPEIPIMIKNNSIEGLYTNVGGIAVTTLAGGYLDCVIDSNVINDNRYGITAYGFDISSVISNNIISNNNIQNMPMQGGSGINFWGGTSNSSMVFGNEIYGNLWGITITGDALPNLGQVDPDTINKGEYYFYDNGNLGEVYANITIHPMLFMQKTTIGALLTLTLSRMLFFITPMMNPWVL